MVTIVPTVDPNTLIELKRRHIDQCSAPLDGMWLDGFVPQAQHYTFCNSESLVGYCCVNSDGFLLQFYVQESHADQRASLFHSVVTSTISGVTPVRGAFASTAEPHYLSLCLDNFKRHSVHAIMYELGNNTPPNPSGFQLTPLTSRHLEAAVEFVMKNTGAPEAWLRGYLATLIDRRELTGYWEGDDLIAYGELRKSSGLQPGICDLGVIVDKSRRGTGLATRTLKQLIQNTLARGMQPICSTEKGNIAAQKAICKAGFAARNLILKLTSE